MPYSMIYSKKGLPVSKFRIILFKSKVSVIQLIAYI